MSQRGVFASSFIVCANWHTPHTAERDSTSVEVRAQDLELQLDLAHSVGTSVWSFGEIHTPHSGESRTDDSVALKEWQDSS